MNGRSASNDGNRDPVSFYVLQQFLLLELINRRYPLPCRSVLRSCAV